MGMEDIRPNPAAQGCDTHYLNPFDSPGISLRWSLPIGRVVVIALGWVEGIPSGYSEGGFKDSNGGSDW